MYTRSAALYDAIYHWKNYGFEAEKVIDLLRRHAPGARTLLDVACGTGQHLGTFKAFYDVAGLDLSAEMLAIAAARHPDIPFHAGDMTGFELNERFDAITCLFSAIGYVESLERLHLAIAAMARHLTPGGTLLVEPWLTPDTYKDAGIQANFADKLGLKIARMAAAELEGTTTVFNYHYLVGDGTGVHHFTERHALGLFTVAEYAAAFTAAGLTAEHDMPGLMGRGLFIGTAPKA